MAIRRLILLEAVINIKFRHAIVDLYNPLETFTGNYSTLGRPKNPVKQVKNA